MLFPTNATDSWLFSGCTIHTLLVRNFLTNVHHANEPNLKSILVNGGYGGVVVYAMHRLLHLLRGPHQCRFRQSLYENVLTKRFHYEGMKTRHKSRPQQRQLRAGKTGSPRAMSGNLFLGYTSQRSSLITEDRSLRRESLKTRTTKEIEADKLVRQIRAHEAETIWKEEHPSVPHPFPGMGFLTGMPWFLLRTDVLLTLLCHR